MNEPRGRDGSRSPTSSTHTSTTTTTHGPVTTTTHFTSTGPQTVVTTPASQSGSTTVVHPTVTTTHQIPFPSAVVTNSERQPSIRIRRQEIDQATQTPSQPDAEENAPSNRRRSSSEPQRPHPALFPLQPQTQDDLDVRRLVTATPLQTLHEEGSTSSVPQLISSAPDIPPRSMRRPAFGREASAINIRARGDEQLYEPNVVDILDVIDPEVSTLTTLNNVQNSLFIPNLGWLYNRQPTYDLSQSSPETSDEEAAIRETQSVQGEQTDDPIQPQPAGSRPAAPRLITTNTISSVLTGTSDGHNYAVLPHGVSLPGWTPQDKAMLNDHVRHLLHSRRAKFKRSMRGFGRYVRKPIGFLVTLYAFLLTFWGAAWVLFLIGWISVEGRQAYFIEICDQILTALFCVVGIGFAPWRAVDTYHMIFVAKYAHKTWRLRKERGLPKLKDRNELPTMPRVPAWEIDEEKDGNREAPVLTAAEQQKLEYHQNKLAKSHTFYKPHETNTHYAFSVRLLIAIVVLLDCHSLFQMALGGTTWGIYYKVRPKALTAVILSFSISCNISAGITISVGDRKSRKRLVVEQMFRQDVTEDALKTLRKEKGLIARGVGKNKTNTKKSKQ